MAREGRSTTPAICFSEGSSSEAARAPFPGARTASLDQCPHVWIGQDVLVRREQRNVADSGSRDDDPQQDHCAASQSASATGSVGSSYRYAVPRNGYGFSAVSPPVVGSTI